MKTIIASQRLVNGAAGREISESLDRRWGKFWLQLGWLLIPASSAIPACQLMDQCRPSALLLTGGNDLAAVNNNPLSQARDVWERDLLKNALSRALPVIGICRGMQFLVTECGGSLSRVQGHAAQRHPIAAVGELVPPFQSDDLNRASVPSFHDFAVSDMPDGMQALARAPDGTVEACVNLDLKSLGIMWHPERETAPDVKDMNLLQHFLEYTA